jgi:hypothetical protein
MSLHKGGVDGVCETEFRDVASHAVFHFVGSESSYEQRIRSNPKKRGEDLPLFKSPCSSLFSTATDSYDKLLTNRLKR